MKLLYFKSNEKNIEIFAGQKIQTHSMGFLFVLAITEGWVMYKFSKRNPACMKYEKFIELVVFINETVKKCGTTKRNNKGLPVL
jgi:hypothetical protein